ncbi:MAG: serine/threonine-protein kinase [Planctomycetota bacterium]
MTNVVPNKKDLSNTYLGAYKLIKRIGKGGMGEVYEAYEELLDRTVAVKVLYSYLSEDDTFTVRFLREARHAAKLEHPAIASIYSAGDSDNMYYIAMQLVKGKTLAEILEERGAIRQSQALLITRAVAGALSFAHSKNIIHRDIKPENIMIDKEGKIKVMDFGLARESCTKSKVTQTGLYLGTPEYSSPEQCETDEIDTRTDIYSLGVVFYEMLTGEVPHTAETPLSLFNKICSEEPTPVRELNTDVSKEVETIVNKMLAKNRERRFANADEVIKAIDKVLKTTNISLDETIKVANVKSAVRHGKADYRYKTKRGETKKSFLKYAATVAVVLIVGILVFLLSDKKYIEELPVEIEHAAATQQQITAPADFPVSGTLASILVLDFDNNTQDSEIEWMKIGVADMFIRDLGQNQYLRVISRDQLIKTLQKLSLDMNHAKQNFTMIAAELKVNMILKGSITKMGGKIRIDTEILDASNAALLSSKSGFVFEEDFLIAVDSVIEKNRKDIVEIIKKKKPGIPDSLLSCKNNEDITLAELIFPTVTKWAGSATEDEDSNCHAPEKNPDVLAEKQTDETDKKRKIENNDIICALLNAVNKKTFASGLLDKNNNREQEKSAAVCHPPGSVRKLADEPFGRSSGAINKDMGEGDTSKGLNKVKSETEWKEKEDIKKSKGLDKCQKTLSPAQLNYHALELYFKALKISEDSPEDESSIRKALEYLDKALSMRANLSLAQELKLQLEETLNTLNK